MQATGDSSNRRAARPHACVPRRTPVPAARRKRTGASAVTICALSIASVLLAGCAETSRPPSPPPPKVTVAQPAQRVVIDYLELTGNTRAIHTVQLVARVSGYLEKVFFKDGQMVRKGQPLFLIEQSTYRDNLRQAQAAILQHRAQLVYADAQLDRYVNLVKQNAASPSDVDNWRYQRDTAQANLRAAEAQRDVAERNLGYTDVRAPFDGRIDRRLKDPGNLVGAGENSVLAEVNRIDPIYVYFNISDRDLARLLKNGQGIPGAVDAREWPAFAGLPDEDGHPHRGRIDFSAISLTATTGTLLMRGVFANPGGKILPGLHARLRVPVDRKPAFLVPDVAVARDQQGSYVLVVNENNIVERRNIKTGSAAEGLLAIEEGLQGKEWVIVNGFLKASPGRPVTPEQEGGAPPRGQAPAPPPPQEKAEP